MTTLKNSARRGTCLVDHQIGDKYRPIPGVKYKSLPNELSSIFYKAADRRVWAPAPTPSDYFTEVAKPWQGLPVASDRDYDGSTFLTFETGLGKTAAAIQLVKDCATILIITSANHRYGWVAEFTRWAGFAPESVVVIEEGSDWKKVTPETKLVVCTSAILYKSGPRKFDAIVFDESQAFKNTKTRAWQAGKALVDNNPKSIRVMLSATPAANEPKDLWGQLELLWPGRFGTQWQFLNRYCQKYTNEYGTTYGDINPKTWKELQARFDAVTFRATKVDAVLGGHVPPLTLNAHMLDRHEDKIGRMLKWTTEVMENHNHVGVFFFHPDSAEEFAERLRGYHKLLPAGTVSTLPLHGMATPKRRMAEVDRVQRAKYSVSICTIEAMGEAIDLTYIERAALCEYSYKPSKIIQFLGRFQRLSCDRAATIDCFAQERTEDEIKVAAVAEKIDAITKCVREGAGEKAVMEIMKINEDKIFEEAKLRMTNDDGGLI